MFKKLTFFMWHFVVPRKWSWKPLEFTVTVKNQSIVRLSSIQISTLSLEFGKLFNFSLPQFPHL